MPPWICLSRKPIKSLRQAPQKKQSQNERTCSRDHVMLSINFKEAILNRLTREEQQKALEMAVSSHFKRAFIY
jgi:hypothetical protein